MKGLVIFGVVVVLLLMFVVAPFVGAYNGLVAGNQTVAESWAQVETQYQRRFDLIPNVVNATKGVLRQEQAVFGAIAEARTRYASAPKGSNERVEATQQYESALARLLVVIENYPVLKSYESVRILTDELAGTENRINVARDRYNQQVKAWNTEIVSFPTNILAKFFGFEAREYFDSEEGASKAPVVDMEL